MARFKPYSYQQKLMIPIDLKEQLQPGTFEFALNRTTDELDLSVFEHRFENDDTGAPAYDPAILLKIVLFAYSRGITSSREISRACRENVVFMALAAVICQCAGFDDAILLNVVYLAVGFAAFFAFFRAARVRGLLLNLGE